jgi:hypothetical protein
MNLPNLIIAGAPKCGTSSLYGWLADHPEACGSTPKETFYLMDYGHPLLRRGANFHEQGLQGYSAFFNNCSKSRKIIFEATTHYVYQRTALEVLSALPEVPLILFMLRKPSERVYSSFQYTKNNLANLRRDISFSEFVRLVRLDSGGAIIKEYAGESAYVLSNDLKYSRYVEYVSLWRERVGSERVEVMLFEEMKENPLAFMKKLAARLGIDSSFYDDYGFPVRNETLSLKYLPLHRRVRKLNGLLPQGGLKSLLKGVYLKAQAVRSGRAPSGKTREDREALAELEQEFRPFNQRLANEFGLDLSAWS